VFASRPWNDPDRLTLSLLREQPLSNSQSIRDGSGVLEAAAILQEQTCYLPPTYDSDYDLRKELPHSAIIDGLVDFYFEYCNWVYRHVNHRAFMAAWVHYKSGAGADRTVLATVCMIMAVTLHYLPPGHELLRALSLDTEVLGGRFYNIMRIALQRRQAESRAYTLELVELLLIRLHYLMLSKLDSEETWHVRGELMTIATAMGLHRDPGKEMPLEVAERRRWAWWHIVLIERYAFRGNFQSSLGSDPHFLASVGRRLFSDAPSQLPHTISIHACRRIAIPKLIPPGSYMMRTSIYSGLLSYLAISWMTQYRYGLCLMSRSLRRIVIFKNGGTRFRRNWTWTTTPSSVASPRLRPPNGA
jgi:hypothetical protein